ncbi:MAG TPA: hypothetical protein VM140_04355 [Burkholderiales bacterium]|nr:hypothetical protein [Burkholderiales bacterium]
MDLMQATYARWLDAATRVGFAVSLAAFLVYVSGAVEPFVPLERLPQLWGLPAARFAEVTGEPSGWGWLGLLGYADYLNLAAVALFGVVTLACYARIVPLLFADGERLQAFIALAQVLVLAAAAAGVFTGGR